MCTWPHFGFWRFFFPTCCFALAIYSNLKSFNSNILFFYLPYWSCITVVLMSTVFLKALNHGRRNEFKLFSFHIAERSSWKQLSMTLLGKVLSLSLSLSHRHTHPWIFLLLSCWDYPDIVVTKSGCISLVWVSLVPILLCLFPQNPIRPALIYWDILTSVKSQNILGFHSSSQAVK